MHDSRGLDPLTIFAPREQGIQRLGSSNRQSSISENVNLGVLDGRCGIAWGCITTNFNEAADADHGIRIARRPWP